MGLLVLTVLISQFGSKLITRPLDKLASATTRIARGEFDVSVPVNSRDEVGTLAQAFNRMATGLEERDKALEEAHVQLVQSEKMSGSASLGLESPTKSKTHLRGFWQSPNLRNESRTKGRLFVRTST